MSYISQLCKDSKNAFNSFIKADTITKNNLLSTISKNIVNNKDIILKNNLIDIENYKKISNNQHMLNRLIITEKDIHNICGNINKIINLDDPVDVVEYGKKTIDNLNIIKKRVPFGVIGIIYESRPNVTIDAACLCIKSGNCCILKGGKESINTNKAIINIIKDSLKSSNLNTNIISLIEDTSRESVTELIKLDDYIDLIIPRGGKNLISYVKKNSTVPIIETGTGNCHVFVDKYADFDMAINIIINAKTSRAYVCNAIESLVVHNSIADKFLPILYDNFKKYNIKIMCCKKSLDILKENKNIYMATDEDFYNEFLDYTISLKIVDNINDAISHINKYSTKHSECIITNSIKRANLFTNGIDSSSVYVNASTRFTDGEKFGFGAEIGISTQKLHARGPMGLNELTTNKYIIIGDGQIRK